MPSSIWVMSRGPRSEVLRKTELAARDDVLLDLGPAAADGVDDGVAVRRLGATLHGCFVGLHAELRARTPEVHRRVRQPLRELGRVELVLRRLRRRRRTTLHRLRDEAQPEHARDLGLRRQPRDLLAYHGVVAQRLAVGLLR